VIYAWVIGLSFALAWVVMLVLRRDARGGESRDADMAGDTQRQRSVREHDFDRQSPILWYVVVLGSLVAIVLCGVVWMYFLRP
jgi:hypothetical protein